MAGLATLGAVAATFVASEVSGEAPSDQSSSSVSPWEDGLGGALLAELGELPSTMVSEGWVGSVGGEDPVDWVAMVTNLGMVESSRGKVPLFVSVVH